MIYTSISLILPVCWISSQKEKACAPAYAFHNTYAINICHLLSHCPDHSFSAKGKSPPSWMKWRGNGIPYYLMPAETHLSVKIFINYLHTPFSVLVTNEKVEFAQRLLKDSNLSLTEIAMESGFSSNSYFSDCFKRTIGISPLQFRKAYTANLIISSEKYSGHEPEKSLYSRTFHKRRLP